MFSKLRRSGPLGSGVLQTLLNEQREASDADERVYIDFKNKRRIGRGGEGDTYKVKVVCDGVEKLCVLKHFRGHDQDDLKTIIHENLTKTDATTIEHNIIKHIGVVSDEGKRYALYPFCEMMLDKKLDRLYQLKSEDPELFYAIAVQIMYDSSLALAYMHEQGIIHRDVKPPNIGYHLGHWCLIDLGAATPTNSPVSSYFELGGTIAYMHPICFLHSEMNTRPFNDFYALGTVLQALLEEGFYSNLLKILPQAYAYTKGVECGKACSQTDVVEQSFEHIVDKLRDRPVREQLTEIATYLTNLRPDEHLNAEMLKNYFGRLFSSITASSSVLERMKEVYGSMMEEGAKDDTAAAAETPFSLSSNTEPPVFSQRPSSAFFLDDDEPVSSFSCRQQRSISAPTASAQVPSDNDEIPEDISLNSHSSQVR